MIKGFGLLGFGLLGFGTLTQLTSVGVNVEWWAIPTLLNYQS